MTVESNGHGRQASTRCDAPVSLVIAYDSGSRGNVALCGRTGVIAGAIGRGAEAVADTRVTLLPVEQRENTWDVLDAADAIVFGCPTYMGSGSAALKSFMEESLRPQWVEQRWKDKLAAGFTNSAGMSGDKLVTLQQLAGFAAQHGMLWVTLGQEPGWQSSTGSADDLNRLASFLGLMAQSNTDQGPELAPPASDRTTAELFGTRIAEATHRWTGGRRVDAQGAQPEAGNARQHPRETMSLERNKAMSQDRTPETDRNAARVADYDSHDWFVKNRKNISVVLDVISAVERRDQARLLELYHPELKAHWPQSLPYGGTFGAQDSHDRTGWYEVWNALQPSERERQMDPRVIAASDDEVVVLWRQRGLSASGERFDSEVLGLYQVRDGKFARAQMFYFDTTAALAFLDRARQQTAN
jgi:NAD(P)H dehydrogenase (quinone)